MGINEIIQSATLGASRKDAQVDCCAVFAAALYDVLSEHGFACQMVSATERWEGWAHALVKVDGRFYDSLGEFSTAIYQARRKIHKSVTLKIEYRKDVRSNCYEPEFDEMHRFYVKALEKAIRLQAIEMASA